MGHMHGLPLNTEFSGEGLPFAVNLGEQALTLGEVITALLANEAICIVPPSEAEDGFYSRYFLVPTKVGGLRPILDQRRLNSFIGVRVSDVLQ